MLERHVLAGMGPILVATDGGEAIATGFARARQLIELAREALAEDPSWPIDIVLGDDAESLARVARDRDACLIVTGQVQHGFVERTMHGEALLALVRAAHTPVLTVPVAIAPRA